MATLQRTLNFDRDTARVLKQLGVQDERRPNETPRHTLVRLLNTFIYDEKDRRGKSVCPFDDKRLKLIGYSRGFFTSYINPWGFEHSRSSRRPAGALAYMISKTSWPSHMQESWRHANHEEILVYGSPGQYSPLPSDARFIEVILHLESKQDDNSGAEATTEQGPIGVEASFSNWNDKAVTHPPAALLWSPKDLMKPLQAAESFSWAVLAMSRARGEDDSADRISLDVAVDQGIVATSPISNIRELYNSIHDLAATKHDETKIHWTWVKHVIQREEWGVEREQQIVYPYVEIGNGLYDYGHEFDDEYVMGADTRGMKVPRDGGQGTFSTKNRGAKLGIITSQQNCCFPLPLSYLLPGSPIPTLAEVHLYFNFIGNYLVPGHSFIPFIDIRGTRQIRKGARASEEFKDIFREECRSATHVFILMAGETGESLPGKWLLGVLEFDPYRLIIHDP